jgi:two-component system, NtrC family, response regulator AlgB
MRILIVDDEPSIRKTTAVALESMGHQAEAAAGGKAAFRSLESSRFDVLFLDLKLQEENGLDLVSELLRRWPQLSIVVFTAFASIETAVEAIRRGAVDYIPKPFTPEQVREVLARVQRTRRLQGRLAELESRLRSDAPSTDLTTNEPAMQRAYEILFKAASTPATILLLGESGTGKTVVARAIHDRSAQRENAFVTVSCPSLSRELLESELFGHVKGAFTGATSDTWGKVVQAEGGTLFLDEIGELPIEIQPKLLRLLQEREYERVGEARTRSANVRLIAATNRNLEEAVAAGRMRADLYYRLNVIAVRLPSLRERPADLLPLARGYLEFFAAQCGRKTPDLPATVEAALRRHAWPGNLRELRNAIERAVILCSGNQILPSDLPETVIESEPDGNSDTIRPGAAVTVEALEAEHIRRVLRDASSLDQAARILGVDPATLYRKRKRLGLSP